MYICVHLLFYIFFYRPHPLFKNMSWIFCTLAVVYGNIIFDMWSQSKSGDFSCFYSAGPDLKQQPSTDVKKLHIAPLNYIRLSLTRTTCAQMHTNTHTCACAHTHTHTHTQDWHQVIAECSLTCNKSARFQLFHTPSCSLHLRPVTADEMDQFNNAFLPTSS